MANYWILNDGPVKDVEYLNQFIAIHMAELKNVEHGYVVFHKKAGNWKCTLVNERFDIGYVMQGRIGKA